MTLLWLRLQLAFRTALGIRDARSGSLRMQIERAKRRRVAS